MPTVPITRAQARSFARRWRLANAAERRELRATSAEQKLRQLAALMASARQMGWSTGSADDALAHDRWDRLRRAYGV